MCKNSPLLSITRIDNQWLTPSGGPNPDCLHITLQLTNIKLVIISTNTSKYEHQVTKYSVDEKAVAVVSAI